MYKSPQFIKKQLAVIEDLFTAELDEAEILKKHGVKPGLYRKWLADEQFTGHLEQRLAQAYHSSRVLLARSVRTAAERLIELAKCGQNETARKACLDIIYPQNDDTVKRASSPVAQTTNESVAPVSLTPEKASEILRILAETPPATGEKGISEPIATRQLPPHMVECPSGGIQSGV
jgi:hypothetical protein